MEKKLEKLKQLKLLHTALQMLCVLVEAKDIVRKKRSCSVRAINRDREQHGFFAVTFKQIKMFDEEQFFIYTRMTPAIYDQLLNLISPHLKKHSIRKSITAECRLAIVLQYLSQASSVQSLAWSFKLGKETVRQIILETCDVIWNTLSPLYVAEPQLEEFQHIEKQFWRLWNMPNCVGAIDGKHIAIRCPPNSGSQFYCYKSFFSIVLLAACDAEYRFTFIDVGAYGSQSDGGIFQASRFGKRLLSNSLPIPLPKELPGTEEVIPHFFVADAAFPLGLNLMRPYPGILLPEKKENFNKRLSRARRTIENSFGILVARWRILLTTIHMLPENVEKVVLACVALGRIPMDWCTVECGAMIFPAIYHLSPLLHQLIAMEDEMPRESGILYAISYATHKYSLLIELLFTWN